MKILINIPKAISPDKFDKNSVAMRQALMAAFKRGKTALPLKGTEIEEGVIQYTTGNVVDVFYTAVSLPPKAAK